jgi:hypothetical protein
MGAGTNYPPGFVRAPPRHSGLLQHPGCGVLALQQVISATRLHNRDSSRREETCDKPGFNTGNRPPEPAQAGHSARGGGPGRLPGLRAGICPDPRRLRHG